MDRNYKSDEAFGQSSSNSRRVMWKLNGEEETFDSLVNYRRIPVRTVCVSAQQNKSQDSSLQNRKRKANESWRLLLRDLVKKRSTIREREMAKKAVSLREPVWNASQTSATSLPEIKESSPKERAAIYWRRLFDEVHKPQIEEQKVPGAEKEDQVDVALTAKPSLALRYKPSHESLKFKRSNELASGRSGPKSSLESKTSKLEANLKLETFSLPPQQTCVVREVEPRFAHQRRMSLATDSDSCCSGELEVPNNSPVLQQEPGSRPHKELIRVHVSAPKQSPLAEGTQRSTTPNRRRNVLSKVNTGTKEGSLIAAPITGGNKCSRTSGSAGTSNMLTLRQRQQELHRYRVMVERRRLDLLELKIAREREEALHNEILFHKDLQIKENVIRAHEDNDCSNA
ncbi:uncharacterized protein LOC108099449 [Drosophila ficusphila]|uniref:uncharacterized protein LOC108099449 n=1 Tax=Drosophila ficusphila TaxID=30025 RepID=UPI0007E7219F|nr:uncharacterized protein LOC108099449 [Drosophila ficusphila]